LRGYHDSKAHKRGGVDYDSVILPCSFSQPDFRHKLNLVELPKADRIRSRLSPVLAQWLTFP